MSAAMAASARLAELSLKKSSCSLVHDASMVAVTIAIRKYIFFMMVTFN
jgi:hypothetical protein